MFRFLRLLRFSCTYWDAPIRGYPKSAAFSTKKPHRMRYVSVMTRVSRQPSSRWKLLGYLFFLELNNFKTGGCPAALRVVSLINLEIEVLCGHHFTWGFATGVLLHRFTDSLMKNSMTRQDCHFDDLSVFDLGLRSHDTSDVLVDGTSRHFRRDLCRTSDAHGSYGRACWFRWWRRLG